MARQSSRKKTDASLVLTSLAAAGAMHMASRLINTRKTNPASRNHEPGFDGALGVLDAADGQLGVDYVDHTEQKHQHRECSQYKEIWIDPTGS